MGLLPTEHALTDSVPGLILTARKMITMTAGYTT